MPLNGINQQFVFADFLEEVNVAVRQHCMGLWPALDVLEDDVAVVDSKDKYPAVEPLSSLGEKGLVVFS